MKQYIQSSYVRYNANNRGTRTGDCVKRALSLAFEIPYVQVSRELNELAKHSQYDYNQYPVYEKFINNHGGGIYRCTEESLTVNEFTQTIGNTGTYIIEAAKKPAGRHEGNHLLCIVDGDVFDSWNSSNWYVVGYYEVNTSHQFTTIDENMDDLNAKGYRLVVDLGQKYMNKYNLDGKFTPYYGVVEGLSINYAGLYVSEDKSHRITIKFTVVFTPSTTLEQAEKVLKDTIKIRMYDRFYAINKQVVQTSEGMKLFRESGYDEPAKLNIYDNSELRFYKGLPAWVKPFVTHIYVQSPGQYSDSYSLTILPIKGDPRNEEVRFEGYESKEIKDELKLYKDTFKRPFDDYSPYEMF